MIIRRDFAGFLIIVASVLLNISIVYLIQVFRSKNDGNEKSSLIDKDALIIAPIQPNYSVHAISKLNLPIKAKSYYKNLHKSTLPRFSNDGSEYIFGSIIELSFDSFGPHITTFFLDHHFLIPHMTERMGGGEFDNDTVPSWKKMSQLYLQRELAEDITYEMSGKRVSKYPYLCRISNYEGEEEYITEGSFVPNRLSIDFYSNRKVDILRCPMKRVSDSITFLKNSSYEVQVEIIWNDASLIKFKIPWITRRTGYLLDSPPRASQIIAWPKPRKNDSWPTVHLCMPLTRLNPSRIHFAIMSEYVSHHLLLGFSHIYFNVAYAWDSEEMNQLVALFQSYISEGSVSIASATYSKDSRDLVVGGMKWHPLLSKVVSLTFALYYAKGFADYLAVFDVDEFFLPKRNFHSIQEIIRDIDFPPDKSHSFTPGRGVKGAKGFADKQKHPLCFMQVLSEVVGRNSYAALNAMHEPWIGSRFSHSQEPIDHFAKYDPYGPKPLPFTYPKPIYPTRRIYQGGIGLGAACRLDWKWTSCGQEQPELEFCEKGYGIPDRESDFHRFDEVVGNKKQKTIQPSTHAIVLHFIIYNALRATPNSLQKKNDYTLKYFPAVLEDLRNRNLEFLLTLS